MKNYSLILGCLICFCISGYAQVTNTLSFQMLVRNSNQELLFEQPVGLRFQIIQGSANGTIVYEETQSVTTNAFGLLSLQIGSGSASIGTYGAIDWSNGPYFISTEVDALGGTSYSLQQTNQLNSLPYAAQSVSAGFAETLDYGDVTNAPITISNNQITQLDFITITQPIDLNATETDVAGNTLKTSFPGFGTTAGTAFEIIWSKIDDNAYYQNGNVGMGTNTDLDMTSAALVIDGGLRYINEPSIETEGQLFYSPIGDTGFLFYTNTLGETKSLGTGDIAFNTEGANIFSDFIVKGSLGAGESMTAGYDFGENEVVLSSATPSIDLRDTSSSAAFPSADWRLKANDTDAMGTNNFSIDQVDTGTTPLKIEALAPSNAFNLLENGNLGIGVSNPLESLELNGSATATSFVGGAQGLTNLPMATMSIVNSGSTTIASDNNSDNVGDIIFQVQNQNALTIQSNGKVTIGTNTSSNLLDVDGVLKAENVITNMVTIDNTQTTQVFIETPANGETIDVTGKGIISITPNTFQQYFLISNTPGQEVVFINKGSSQVVIQGQLIVPNGTVTFVNANGFKFVTSVN